MTGTIRLPCFKGSLSVEFYDGMLKTVHATVPPETIAHGLSGVGRFGGQTDPTPYTVGEHSVRLAWLLDDWGYGEPFQAAALLHDAPECFGVGDLNSFIKRALGLDRLKHLDTAIAEALWVSLGCEAKYRMTWSAVEPVIDPFDKWLGHHEAQHFSFYVPPEAKFDPAKFRIPGRSQTALRCDGWSPRWAKTEWLLSWSHLMEPHAHDEHD